MTTLYIFGDEAGTMPVSDDGGIFVAAVIAGLRIPPSYDHRKTRAVAWLAAELTALSALPFAAFVVPRPGYARALSEKIERINDLARIGEDLTGSRNPFRPAKGISPANHVWTVATSIAIGQSVFSAIVSGATVDRVEVLLDEKTMRQEQRDLFLHGVRGAAENLRGTLREALRIDRVAKTWEGRLRLDGQSTSVHWSDESAVSDRDRDGGLHLAHRLASGYYGELKSRSGGLRKLLAGAGCGRDQFEHDVTATLMAPLPDDSIKRWEQRHGLR